MSETQINLSKVTLRMAIAFGMLFSLNSLCTCIMVSLSNANWATMSAQAKFLIIVGITANWTGTIMAFLSKTVARLEAGKGLTNGTEFFTRTGTTQLASPPPEPNKPL